MSKPKETAHQPRMKCSFDVLKPLKTGFFKKQGNLTKTMNERFFVLYPNFLVYYSEPNKWLFDKTVGNLGSRKNALKLTDASVSIPSRTDHPSNCKFPFVIHAPDPANPKESYVMDTTSGDERNGWIDAINATKHKNYSSSS